MTAQIGMKIWNWFTCLCIKVVLITLCHTTFALMPVDVMENVPFTFSSSENGKRKMQFIYWSTSLDGLASPVVSYVNSNGECKLFSGITNDDFESICSSVDGPYMFTILKPSALYANVIVRFVLNHADGTLTTMEWCINMIYFSSPIQVVHSMEGMDTSSTKEEYLLNKDDTRLMSLQPELNLNGFQF